MRECAVLGSPIAHSLSPALHSAAYAELGLADWSYRAIECDQTRLPALLAESGPEVVGYSCTMPLKRAALACADVVTDTARAIGAANTLIRTDQVWLAENTDWIGIRDALGSAPRSVLILGAGGTAQAALAALPDAELVTVAVRDLNRTGELLAASERLGRPVKLVSLADTAADADLVISTLPAHAGDSLAGLPWRPEHTLLDVAYQPWPSQLAVAVRSAGATVISGAVMLLYQAAAQVQLMTGSTAPVAAMRAALLKAAPGCGV